ncbi:MAG: acyl-CoA dehydrogenase [Amycolatopsis sp.]|jgi:alkylation response protein AidB-like acyl-CoA dehydrogenase|uniref:acyl-CoA dehydrogenase family protein n=1 Tax=Amycolatopsis sp. TaxID=37632 RepID=UPI00262D5BA5|nr:acyl-CoA dehydrogenase family protein [Amycolatopsis sp.]MCU1683916.1 acyl-CoA dehydrogenase [Amycolatopsis sp.]
MGVEFSSEQQEFAKAIANFAKREAGTREQRDQLTNHDEQGHNQALYEKMAALGWLGLTVSEAYGGSGATMVDMCILLEETARGMLPISAIGPTLITGGPYQKFGTEAQKDNVLRGIVRGVSQSISMSEPEAGSDVGNLSTKAEKTSDGWLINGQKSWCSNAHISENILLVARTDRSGGKHEGLTMFHVPAKTHGLKISPIELMGGLNETNDLYFTDVLLPADAVIGEVGNGWRQLMAGLNFERLIIAAQGIGTARRAFDDTLQFVSQRKQFGRPIGSFQALRHRLADLATEIECTKLLVYSVAREADAHPDKMLAREASMAKLKATETAKQVALAGMQMMGACGYAREFDMEKHVRSTLVTTILGGTSEIQRDIIGKTYGL